MNNINNMDNIDIIINVSKNIKFISLLTAVGLTIIILTNFLPMIHWSIELVGKLITLIILIYAIKLIFVNTNDILSKTKNIFVDPGKKELKNIALLSYLFAIFIFVLIIVIIQSLFYYS